MRRDGRPGRREIRGRFRDEDRGSVAKAKGVGWRNKVLKTVPEQGPLEPPGGLCKGQSSGIMEEAEATVP